MNIIQTAIPEVVLIEPEVFSDDRGWFIESFNEQQFHEELVKIGLPVPRPFVQDNHSCSKLGVLRGLHYQVRPHEQGKLVRVVQGAVFDVAVDIREDSNTFGRWVGAILSGKNRHLLWIPEGFAHGFIALEDETHFLYKTTDYYSPTCERSILWSDPALAIDWPNIEEAKPIVSNKDREAQLLSLQGDL